MILELTAGEPLGQPRGGCGLAAAGLPEPGRSIVALVILRRPAVDGGPQAPSNLDGAIAGSSLGAFASAIVDLEIPGASIGSACFGNGGSRKCQARGVNSLAAAVISYTTNIVYYSCYWIQRCEGGRGTVDG